MQLKFTNPDRARLGYQLAVLSFATLHVSLNILREIGDVQPRYLARGAFVFLSSVLTAPLRLLERLCFGRAVASLQLDPAPVFIVGHWRSGTTHLHNLMSQDPKLGYVSMYQAILPESSLIAERWLKPLLSKLVPLARPMDDMVWPLDSPQEEEIPFSKCHSRGFYTRLLFPGKLVDALDRDVLLQGASESERGRWKQRYLGVLKKASYRCGGRRLVLKNPVNTGRIPLLLELFPDAKFVFVHRNPYEVFLSTRRLHESLLDIVGLQASDRAQVERNVLAVYPKVMRRYLEARARIPAGNRVEVRFDDLARDPHREIRRVYESLDLPGFEQAEPHLQAYIESQAGYQPARYEVDRGIAKRVDEAWGFAFEAFGYERQERTPEAGAGRRARATRAHRPPHASSKWRLARASRA